METRRCHYCGKEYAVDPTDSLRAYNDRSPWLDDVCKRCTCYLRQYHTWTVTDDGFRLCGYCYLGRYPLATVVRKVSIARKRELVEK